MDYNVYEELSRLNENLSADTTQPIVGVYELENRVFMAAADSIMSEIRDILNATDEEIANATGLDFSRPVVFEAIINNEITNYVKKVLWAYTGEMKAREARVKEVRSVFPDMYDEEGNLLPPKEDQID